MTEIELPALSDVTEETPMSEPIDLGTVRDRPMVPCDGDCDPYEPSPHLRPARAGDTILVPCPHRGSGGGVGGQTFTEIICWVCDLSWLSSNTAGRHPDDGLVPAKLTEDPRFVRSTIPGHGHWTLRGYYTGET